MRPIDPAFLSRLIDGAYIFSNPLAAEQLGLALLVIVFNNSSWTAVGTAVRKITQDGWAGTSGNSLLDVRTT